MSRKITVKGVGSFKAKPDYVVLSLTLDTIRMNYEKAMNREAEKLELLTNALTSIGIKKDAIKTTNFNVETRYESEKDVNNNYKRVFKGFVCHHNLKVGFDFDSKFLTEALQAVASSIAHPEFTIHFTVKNPNDINEELLRSATKNALKKAEILCDAANCKLGELHSIDYNWGEIDVYSNTRYNMSDDLVMMASSKSIDIEPDDINVSDSVTFVWEIE